MKWLKSVVVVLVAVVAVLAVAPFFVRLNDYIPTIEKEVSARIGEPVSIKNLHVSLLPVPQGIADEITIGGGDKIRVAKLTVVPELWSLLREVKVMRTIDLDDLELPQQSLGALVALTQADRGAGKVRIEKIRLSNAQVKLEKAKFGPFDVQVDVSAEPGKGGHLTLKTRDGALRTDVTPQGDRYLLELVAHGWTPPLGPPVRFDELTAKGVIRAKDADLNTIEAKLYGGHVSGKATVAWDKGVTVKGNLDVQRVELRDALVNVSPKARLSGKLDARPVFNSHAQTTAQLGEELKVETPFTVHEGILHGVDLMAAATSFGKSASGGDTRFDELAGQLRIDGHAYRFSDLRISSGPLAVHGALQVAPSRALSGRVNANASALGRIVSVPLNVSGTVDAPTISPDARALAAAAAGTALLGPGVGTAAGAKLGEVVEGLLGNRRKR